MVGGDLTGKVASEIQSGRHTCAAVKRAGPLIQIKDTNRGRL